MADLSAAQAGAMLRRAASGIAGQVRRALTRGVALGEDAREVAREVGRYFNPWHAPRRGPTGALLRAGRDGGQGWPLAPGRAAMAARRLLMTETSRAHGRAVVAVAAGTGRLVRWELAASHPKVDECDTKASHDGGDGPGVYRPGEVPAHPSHPNCRCTLTLAGAAG